MSKNLTPLQHCISLIEKQLGWGKSEDWKTSDFELLSEKIFAKTAVNLSVSTLRRLWGKVKYESEPQPTTLNALAKFLGFKNFREFTDAYPAIPEELPYDDKKEPKKVNFEKTKPSVQKIAGVVLLALSFGALVVWKTNLFKSPAPELDKNQFSFSSQPVSTGIPNSVVFEFDVSNSESDSIFIQQSWDSSKKFQVEKTQNQATSIYYYPGFFNAKLLIDDEIINEHGLLIPSDGWLSLVVKEPIPIYFLQGSTQKNGFIQITEADLLAENIALQPELPISSFYFVDDFGGFSSQSFSMETRFRNTFSKGNGPCQFAQLAVLTKNIPLVLSFSIPGCTSELGLMLSEKMVDEKKTDLSQLGVNVEEWIDLKLSVVDQKVSLFLNSKLVFEDSYSEDAGEIIGLAYHFEGSGEVDFVYLSDENGKPILQEDF